MTPEETKIAELLAESELTKDQQQALLLGAVASLAPVAAQMELQAAVNPSYGGAASTFWEFLLQLLTQLLPILLKLLTG